MDVPHLHAHLHNVDTCGSIGIGEEEKKGSIEHGHGHDMAKLSNVTLYPVEHENDSDNDSKSKGDNGDKRRTSVLDASSSLPTTCNAKEIQSIVGNNRYRSHHRTD